MRIVCDSDFDRGAWPGPLEGRSASAGEAWVGEAGLLGLLETAPADPEQLVEYRTFSRVGLHMSDP